MIIPATREHLPAIQSIYNHYISKTTATFEEDIVSPEQVRQRVNQVQSHDLPWLVGITDSQVAGYAYATPWRPRSAYRFSVEVTVYIDSECHRQGWGARLYEALFEELQSKNIHAAMAGITLPNDPSVALHEKMGMQKVAHFTQVGFKFGQWLDVGYWQIVF